MMLTNSNSIRVREAAAALGMPAWMVLGALQETGHSTRTVSSKVLLSDLRHALEAHPATR